MEYQQPHYQTEFIATAYTPNVEWDVVMDGGVPKLLGVPGEITEGLAEAYTKITLQIDKEEQRIGAKLVRYHPVVELVEEDPMSPVPSPGVYFKITVHVSLED